MLNACDSFESRSISSDGIISNPWDDKIRSNSFPTTPRSRFARLANGHGIGNGSATESLVSSSSSTSPSPSGKTGLRSRKVGSHRRVSTVDSSHPLQPEPPTTPTSSKTATTRPSLNRRLRSLGEYHFDESEGESFESDLGEDEWGKSREVEIMAIVHEVTRTDSIAGVALKYGVSLADLRRANHLWTSDSIHLRKVLHIPLHLSNRKDLFFPANERSVAHLPNGSSSSSSLTVSSSSTDAETSIPAHSQVTIQRIPLSQLAFFPPPSQQSTSVFAESKRKRSPFSSSSPSNFPAGSATTIPLLPSTILTTQRPSRIHLESSSLSTFLKSLPLPTKDVLFSRLSLDSNSNETSTSTSSATNASEASSDQELDVEMDLLGQSRVRSSSSNRSRKRTLSAGLHADNSWAPSSKAKGKMKDTRGDDAHRNSVISIETLRLGGKYTYGANDDDERTLDTPLVPLQTEQLKPSPQMQLPTVLKRDDR